jgi:peptidoglycan/xylan/chitin deacetylase (PgdA/CDA1 family)
MSRRLVFSTLLTASVVWGRSGLEYRATPQVYDACINANDIALTFDDGPYIYLRSISDQFTAAGAKATFFMNGNNWDCIYNADRISDVKYAYAAGHMIGSHTWSHADLTAGLSNAQIEDAMFRMEEAFSRILGIKPAFMRPPYGDYNSNIQSIAAGRGQNLALWDWDTGDADGNTTAQSEAVYNDVANAKVKNALILEHETEETTATVLVPFALNLFKSKGYNIVTMADCLGIAPYQAIGVPQQQTSAWTCDGTPDPGDVCGGSIACETGTPVFSTTTSGPTSTTTPTGPTPTATFIHPTASAAKCLSAASNADGAAVEIEDCVSGSKSQGWTISGSNLQIFGNKCLDVTNGATADGTLLQIWTCATGNTNQMWTVSGNTIQWSGHSLCLDLTNGVSTDGNVMQIWDCTGGPNQQWTRTTS